VVNGARGRWAALGVLCLSLLAIVIDNTIVNVALPTLVRDLDADVSELQWVVDAYTLVLAGLLLLAGTLGDRFGRRRTLLAGLAVFGLASAAAAYAGGVDLLIADRAIMGAGAAFIMPATLSLLVTVFTDARERSMAIGIWAATAGLGMALGPVVGGFLLDRFWWGSIFIVNVPLCAVAIVVGRKVIPESRDPLARRIDWTGAALSGVGLIAFVWAVIEAPSKGWTSAEVIGAGAFAAVAVSAFVVHQRRAEEPLLDLRLFRNPRFTAASSTIMVLFFALFGFLFLSTQYVQFVLGYSPSAAGLRVLPYAGAMIVFATLSAKLVLRFGTKRIATTGMVLFSTGLAVAATVTVSTGYGRLGIALVLMGAGMGIAGAPATESITGSLPPERANIGSAVNDTTGELGGALGVAIVGSIMSSLYSTQLAKGIPTSRSTSAAATCGARASPPTTHRRRTPRCTRMSRAMSLVTTTTAGPTATGSGPVLGDLERAGPDSVLDGDHRAVLRAVCRDLARPEEPASVDAGRRTGTDHQQRPHGLPRVAAELYPRAPSAARLLVDPSLHRLQQRPAELQPPGRRQPGAARQLWLPARRHPPDRVELRAHRGSHPDAAGRVRRVVAHPDAGLASFARDLPPRRSRGRPRVAAHQR
jgi:EmrB/QacA subfamily drug resistance transporter